MSFRHLPPAHGIAQRVVFAVAYLSITLAGIAAFVFTPVTIAGTLGLTTTYMSGVLALIGGPVGFLSVAADRWRSEMWATPLATGGSVAYVIGVWSLVGGETMTRLMQASWVSVVPLLLIARWIHVWSVASQERRKADRRHRLDRFLNHTED